MAGKFSKSIIKKVIVSTLSILVGCTNVPPSSNQTSSLKSIGHNIVSSVPKVFGTKSTTDPNAIRKMFISKKILERGQGKPGATFYVNGQNLINNTIPPGTFDPKQIGTNIGTNLVNYQITAQDDTGATVKWYLVTRGLRSQSCNGYAVSSSIRSSGSLNFSVSYNLQTYPIGDYEIDLYQIINNQLVNGQVIGYLNNNSQQGMTLTNIADNNSYVRLQVSNKTGDFWGVGLTNPFGRELFTGDPTEYFYPLSGTFCYYSNFDVVRFNKNDLAAGEYTAKVYLKPDPQVNATAKFKVYGNSKS